MRPGFSMSSAAFAGLTRTKTIEMQTHQLEFCTDSGYFGTVSLIKIGRNSGRFGTTAQFAANSVQFLKPRPGNSANSAKQPNFIASLRRPHFELPVPIQTQTFYSRLNSGKDTQCLNPKSQRRNARRPSRSKNQPGTKS
jgi:hypothetical protein